MESLHRLQSLVYLSRCEGLQGFRDLCLSLRQFGKLWIGTISRPGWFSARLQALTGLLTFPRLLTLAGLLAFPGC